MVKGLHRSRHPSSAAVRDAEEKEIGIGSIANKPADTRDIQLQMGGMEQRLGEKMVEMRSATAGAVVDALAPRFSDQELLIGTASSHRTSGSDASHPTCTMMSR